MADQDRAPQAVEQEDVVARRRARLPGHHVGGEAGEGHEAAVGADRGLVGGVVRRRRRRPRGAADQDRRIGRRVVEEDVGAGGGVDLPGDQIDRLAQEQDPRAVAADHCVVAPPRRRGRAGGVADQGDGAGRAVEEEDVAAPPKQGGEGDEAAVDADRWGYCVRPSAHVVAGDVHPLGLPCRAIVDEDIGAGEDGGEHRHEDDEASVAAHRWR